MSTKSLSAKQRRQGAQTVRVVLDHHFGKPGSGKLRIIALAGGLTNQVFSVRHAEGQFIVRLGGDSSKISDFMKEQWAIATAREQGVPAPEVLQVGNEPAPVPYMISRQSTGEVATHHPGRLSIVRELGRYAAIINSIRTDGYGSTFDWSHNQLTKNETWSAFLQTELKMEERLEALESRKMLDAVRIKRLRATLEGLGAKGRTTALNHGDLRLKNVLVNDKGKITCILDWEHCMSNLAPEWDLSLALHDLSIDAKQELLAGYGLTPAQISAMSPAWKAITVINYASAVQHAAREKDTTQLESLRTRLSGQLDLYSL
jgi:hygromycin-B 4-O-kinase